MLSIWRCGGSIIFHFTKFDPDFICILIRPPRWVFLPTQNIEILLLDFLWLGSPPGMKKTFWSLILLGSVFFNGTRGADHKYYIFIKIRFANKKKSQELCFFGWYKKRLLFWRLCCTKVLFELFQWPHYQWLSCPLSRSRRTFQNNIPFLRQ